MLPSFLGADPWSRLHCNQWVKPALDLGSVVRSLEAPRGKKTTSRRPTDPWSLWIQAQREAEAVSENVVLRDRDLGSVRGCTNSGQPHWSCGYTALRA